MNVVKFNLKYPKAESSIINMLYFFTYYTKDANGKEKYEFLKYSTGMNIQRKYWDFKKQRAKQTREFPEFLEFNQSLDNYVHTINKIYLTLKNAGIRHTPTLLRNELDKIYRPSPKPQQLSFIQFIENLIQTTNKKIGTIKSYESTLNHLYEFQKSTGKRLELDNIDLNFYDEFISFLTDLKFTPNTLGKHIKNIKVFMNNAIEKQLTTNVQFKSKSFKTIRVDSDSIYLTEQEIESIYNLDLSGDIKMDNVRDLFVIACKTGLRFSDLKNIAYENFINDRTELRITIVKTGEEVQIPVHNWIKEMLFKHHNVLPRVISNQKMNSYLKVLGRMAGINEPIRVTKIKGGIRYDEVYNKFQKITVHTARRSFATNTYLSGIPTIAIMRMTGHRTESSFMKYIKVGSDENSKLLLNHPFFNAKPKLKVS